VGGGSFQTPPQKGNVLNKKSGEFWYREQKLFYRLGLLVVAISVFPKSSNRGGKSLQKTRTHLMAALTQ